MSNATLNYTITTSQAIMFDNANSYIQIQVSPLDGSSEAAYVELPDEVANDRHIQKMFSSTEGGTVTNGVLFDIYFPRLPNLSSMPIKIYPAGTDPSLINESTLFSLPPFPSGARWRAAPCCSVWKIKKKTYACSPEQEHPHSQLHIHGLQQYYLKPPAVL
ncbi:hypothetical protein L271_00190 [Brucella abortus 01-0065]|nr:hypothetical protein L274_00190 [Brucella abortus B10-0973]EPG87950.1 hypothetical protein L271_00190 [Brucella abortus 01-0065]